MITYKEVYENQRFGKIKDFFSLSEVQTYADDTWAYNSNVEAIVYPQEDPFIPAKYLVSEKEYISGHCADVLIAVKGTFPTATKSVFVAGKIWNESIEMRSNCVWYYLFRISD